ncbi:MAG: holo-ACP synthase [Ruminococcus sp.]|nr:holo-ACP synthase [Ruminococcus sp.]
MIAGVGCDLIEVERVKRAASRESFCRRAFSAEEMEFFSQFRDPAQEMAGVWAVKEAFSKSIGTGVRGFSLNEITVAHDELGAPYLVLCGNAAKCAGDRRFHISISHTKEYAQAFCVAEK